jgi:hypothetical protein
MSADAVLSVGLYTYSTQPRGSVVHCAALADALVEAGHRVTVYALAKPGADRRRELLSTSRRAARLHRVRGGASHARGPHRATHQ